MNKTKENIHKLFQTLKEINVNITNAKNTKDYVKVIVDPPDSFRNATRYLEKEQIEFHTHVLPEGKLLKAVIRDLSEAMKTY